MILSIRKYLPSEIPFSYIQETHKEKVFRKALLPKNLENNISN